MEPVQHADDGISIRLRPHEFIPPHEIIAYRMAGMHFISDTAFAELAPFQTTTPAHLESLAKLEMVPNLSGLLDDKQHRIQGMVAGKLRDVCYRQNKKGYVIDVENIGRFFVSVDGNNIIGLQIDTNANDTQLTMGMLGPPLIIALAFHDIWCLHASAVEIDGNAYLFLGESGDGKSTLARELARSDENIHSLGDDLMPVSQIDKRLVCRANFPQLKLSKQQQFNGYAKPLTVKAVFILYPIKHNADKTSVRFKKLTAADATQRMLRCSMGSALFNDTLRQHHLQALAVIYPKTTLLQLDYPHSRNSINEIGNVLHNLMH